MAHVSRATPAVSTCASPCRGVAVAWAPILCGFGGIALRLYVSPACARWSARRDQDRPFRRGARIEQFVQRRHRGVLDCGHRLRHPIAGIGRLPRQQCNTGEAAPSLLPEVLEQCREGFPLPSAFAFQSALGDEFNGVEARTRGRRKVVHRSRKEREGAPDPYMPPRMGGAAFPAWEGVAPHGDYRGGEVWGGGGNGLHG